MAQGLDGLMFSALILAFCTIGAIRAALDIRLGRQSVSWPVFKGRVRESFARNYVGKYQPVVRYEYEVEGILFRGDTIAHVTFFVAKYAIEPFVRGFRPGAEIDVRVNPNRPQDSVLRPGARFQSWVLLVGAISIGAFVIYQLLAAAVR